VIALGIGDASKESITNALTKQGKGAAHTHTLSHSHTHTLIHCTLTHYSYTHTLIHCTLIHSHAAHSYTHTGSCVALVTGGAKESMLAAPFTSNVVLKNRAGFVKMALRTGELTAFNGS
jgi:hypothetical protein